MSLDPTAIKELSNAMAGAMLTPADAGYDDARQIWNGMIDRRPALIARCAATDDVVAAVNFGRDHGLDIAVRSGGHSFPGLSVCDGGLMIDLAPMKAITVDPAARRVRAEGGVLWGELDAATHQHGLATTGGQVSHTGIGGLTLGGGMGWIARRYGMVCDNLRSATIVLADGRVLTVSDQDHPDLFWALRGGGGNFGVVTSFEYQLHELHTVLGGLIGYPLAEAEPVLAGWREIMAAAPDELTTTVAFLHTPDGHPAVGIAICYAGDPTAGEEVVEPLARLGTVAMRQTGPMPYPAVQSMLDATAQPGWRYYIRGAYLDDAPSGLIETFASAYAAVPSPRSLILLWQWGGAISRVASDATAYPHRNMRYMCNVFGICTDPAEDQANVGWVRRTWGDIEPFLAPSLYVNDIERDEAPERIRDAYPEATYHRLAAIKGRYDSENLFHLNQNIEPAPAVGETA